MAMTKNENKTLKQFIRPCIRGIFTMVRTHKNTQNESNLLFLVTFFAIMTLSEQIKVSQSSPSMWLSVLEKI